MIWHRYILSRIVNSASNILWRIIARGLLIGYGARILRKSKFEGGNKIERFSVFGGKLGFGSYVGANSLVTGCVGRYCSIGNNVQFLTATHPTKNFVSTHPAFYSMKRQSGFTYVSSQKFDEYPKCEGTDYSVVVGNDVYIGFGATIIGPVRIGDGAVVAANATVTSDVEPYAIVAGIPAKIVRMRFTKEEIDFLLELKWWEKDESWISAHADLFSDVRQFMKQMKLPNHFG